MPVTVRDEALDHFLIREWRDDGPHQLGDESGRLCVTAGAIAERNLKRALTTEDVPAPQAAVYSTIEDLARVICSAHHGRRAAIIDAHLKRRVIRSVLENAETDAPESTFERFVARRMSLFGASSSSRSRNLSALNGRSHGSRSVL